MIRRILGSLLALMVAAAAIGGTLAAFNDTETSSGNTIAAGTLDLAYDDENATLAEHPSWGRDYTVFTGFGGAGISPNGRVALTAADASRYTTQGDWDAAAPDPGTGKRVEFKFPGMTSDAVTINTAVLLLDWQQAGGITNARVYASGDNGVTYSAEQVLAVPAAATAGLSEVNLKALGLDTSSELNSLVVRFQAWGAAARTSFDLARVVVSYTGASPLTPLVEFASLRPGESQSITLSVSNSGTLAGTAQLTFKSLLGANEGAKSSPETADESASGPYVTEELAAADVDNPQTYMRVALAFGGVAVDIAGSFAESAADNNGFFDLAELEDQTVTLGDLPGGASKDVTITVDLDPSNETGNVFRHDKVTFNVEFGVVQNTP